MIQQPHYWPLTHQKWNQSIEEIPALPWLSAFCVSHCFSFTPRRQKPHQSLTLEPWWGSKTLSGSAQPPLTSEPTDCYLWARHCHCGSLVTRTNMALIVIFFFFWMVIEGFIGISRRLEEWPGLPRTAVGTIPSLHISTRRLIYIWSIAGTKDGYSPSILLLYFIFVLSTLQRQKCQENPCSHQ